MKGVVIGAVALMPIALAAPVVPAQAKKGGSLQVVADGVPQGRTARIMVAGKKFSKKLPSTGRLRNLTPGTYRVWASPIVVDGGTAAVPNLPVKVKVRKRAVATLRLGYSWNPRIDFYPPSPATSLQVTGRSASSIQLSWKNGPAPDLAGVAVRRQEGRTAPTALDEGKVVPVAQRATSVRDSEVRAGTTYSYSVFMVDTSGNVSSPVSVTGRSVGSATAVTSGLSHSCALEVDPDGEDKAPSRNRVVCWGAGSYGQLGDGLAIDSSVPLNVDVPAPVAVEAGGDHSCVTTESGAVWCWGRNDDGQVGNGTTENALVPVQLRLSDVRSVAVGYAHTCAALKSGKVECWGANSSGQTGAPESRRELEPVQVPDIDNAVDVAAGYAHSCALLETREVRCWGADNRGQLGGEASANPTWVDLSGVTLITAGVNHTCAQLETDRVACWGANDLGQLGDGTTTDHAAPVTLPTRDVTSVSAGVYHTCAAASGAARCWGRNGNGRLGDGSTTDRLVPTQVKGLAWVSGVAAGGYHSCSLLAATVRCWGSNGHGQLGNRTTEDSLVAVAVDGL